MPQRSIRFRILSRLIPLIFMAWASTALTVYLSARFELADALNAQTDILAIATARMQGETIDTTGLADGFERYQNDYLIRVRGVQGDVLYSSQPDLPSEMPSFERSAVVTLAGTEWRFMRYRTESGTEILIGRQQEEAEELVLRLVLSSVVPLALVFAGALVAMLLIVRTGLKPLTDLSDDLAKRSAAQLEPIGTSGQPEELRPIAASLNDLFGRIQRFVTRERRFIDDAAHELRTPLTIVKAQCQAIDPTSLSAENKLRLDNIVAGIDRATVLGAQLLDQAQAEQGPVEQGAVKIRVVIRRVLADLTPDADRCGIAISLDAPDDVIVRCSPDDLSAMLSNVVDNAIKYGRAGGRVVVSLSSDGVIVEDDGPGISSDMRGDVFERFVRLDTTAVPGTGLGLSVVRALAERNGMEVGISESQAIGGALFYLRFASD